VRSLELLDVYVPAPDSGLAAVILAGSAIVGQPGTDRTLVHYEGDRFGRGMDFHTRLELAASRLLERYPTVACAAARADDLVEVGHYEPDWRTLTLTDPAALAAWCNVDVADLDRLLGTPRPPARVERDHPEYLARLSARIVACAPLSSTEVHDAASRLHLIDPQAQRLLTGTSGS
jgi:hypothetical protein